MEVVQAPPPPVPATGPSPSRQDETLLHAELEAIPSEVVFFCLLSWAGKKYEMQFPQSDTVGDIKVKIWSLTTVPPDRQKLVGIVKGKLPAEEVEVANLGWTPGKRITIMMVGTPEGSELKEVGPTKSREKEVDIDYAAQEQIKAAQNVRNRRKLAETAAALEVNVMSEPRAGKKLLVLDLDYCILDTGLWKEGSNFNASFFARPFLHAFLKAISPYYDIVIWSQTSWRWLEGKLVELQILGDEKAGDYPVVFTLDRNPMFSVYSADKHGKPFKHEVKALGIIWDKFPAFYSAKNTIHVDDLSRNFAMNVRNGLRVHAYRDAMVNQTKDRELAYVARYLLYLTTQPDFSALNHKRFRDWPEGASLPDGIEDPVATWKLPINGEGQSGSAPSVNTSSAQPEAQAATATETESGTTQERETGSGKEAGGESSS